MADDKANGALERELRAALRGDVDFGPGARALYATDSSNYRQVPVGVILPRDADDVEAALAACRRHGAVVLPRGCGTSLAGQTCNEAVVFDFSRYMHEILVLDHDRQTARVQPGIVLDTLRAAAERRDLTFGPDPVTHNRCTLGGMIGNDSCGVHSVMSGKTVDNVHELDIVTYDGLRLRVGPTSDQDLDAFIRAGGRRGEIYGRLRDLRDRSADLIRARFPDIPRRVSGFGLDQLLPEHGFNVARALVGSEGTCVTVVEALLRLIPSPQARVLLVLGYPDIASAGDHVPEILPAGPIGLEAFDDRLLRTVQRKNTFATDLLPAGSGFLIAEFGADELEEATEQARQLMFALHHMPDPPAMALYTDPAQMARVWKIREAGVGASAYTPGQKRQWPGWEDAGVPPDKVGPYLRDLRALMDKYGYNGVLYGHFGQGCIHNRIDFDFETAHGVEQFRRFVHEAAEQVVAYGGSLSGEHGDGQARGELLPIMYGEELMAAFREFKAIWDPHNKMNPGKLIDAARVDANLRLGVDYRPVEPATHFAYVNDEFSFAKATLRCVGVGECRRLATGTMCPSYMVTGEEQHSTRGRARLLFEMLQRDPLTGGWSDKDVAEALDWCLACKGCKSDCPAKVDMATYKAEFRAHYYKGRPRPRAAYALGLIYWWSRLAAAAPGLANLATQTPGLRAVAKAIGGIAHERTLPAFASQPFTKWFREREKRGGGLVSHSALPVGPLDLDDGTCDEPGTAGRLVTDDCAQPPGIAAAPSDDGTDTAPPKSV